MDLLGARASLQDTKSRLSSPDNTGDEVLMQVQQPEDALMDMMTIRLPSEPILGTVSSHMISRPLDITSRDRALSGSSEDLPTLSQTLGLPRRATPAETRLDPRASSTAHIDDESDESDDCVQNVPAERQGTTSAVPSLSSGTSSPLDTSSRRPLSPSTIVKLHDLPQDDEFIGGRRLRKRTAAQKNPYQSEFAKYVLVAKRNQWDGIIIPAGLNLSKEIIETPVERAARVERQKLKKVDTQGGWLELEAGKGVPLHPEDIEPTKRSPHQTSESDDECFSLPSAMSSRSRQKYTVVQASVPKQAKGKGVEPFTYKADLDVSIDTPCIRTRFG